MNENIEKIISSEILSSNEQDVMKNLLNSDLYWENAEFSKEEDLKEPFNPANNFVSKESSLSRNKFVRNSLLRNRLKDKSCLLKKYKQYSPEEFISKSSDFRIEPVIERNYQFSFNLVKKIPFIAEINGKEDIYFIKKSHYKVSSFYLKKLNDYDFRSFDIPNFINVYNLKEGNSFVIKPYKEYITIKIIKFLPEQSFLVKELKMNSGPFTESGGTYLNENSKKYLLGNRVFYGKDQTVFFGKHSSFGKKVPIKYYCEELPEKDILEKKKQQNLKIEYSIGIETYNNLYRESSFDYFEEEYAYKQSNNTFSLEKEMSNFLEYEDRRYNFEHF